MPLCEKQEDTSRVSPGRLVPQGNPLRYVSETLLSLALCAPAPGAAQCAEVAAASSRL